MPRSLCTLGLLLIAASSAGAQPLVIDPTHRPDDFSNIVGKYSIKASAEPTEVHVEEAITLRIEITGEGPAKYEPKFKDLRLFPDYWKDDFYIQELPELREVLREKKTWVFVYRLKPKHAKVKEINDIKLCFFNDKSLKKNKYESPYAEPPIPIKVTPRPDTSGTTVIPKLEVAPPSFYERFDSSRVLKAPAAFTPSILHMALFLAVPPIACLIGAFLWRRWFPDDVQLARRHRDRSGFRAIGHLHGNDAAAWEVVRRYLRERFDFPATDAVPAEVAAFLKRRGFAKTVCEQARVFFQACDAVRFNAAVQGSLAADAIRLIEAMEADPCARA